MEEEFDLQKYIADYIKEKDEKKRFDIIKIDYTNINNIVIEKNKDLPKKYDITFNYKQDKSPEKSPDTKYENSFVNVCEQDDCMVCKTVTDTKLYTFYKLKYRINRCDNCIINSKLAKINKHIMFPNIEFFGNAYKCRCHAFTNTNTNTNTHILPVHKYLKYVNNNDYSLNYNSDLISTVSIDKMAKLGEIIQEIYGKDYLDRFLTYVNVLIKQFYAKLYKKEFSSKIFDFIKMKSCIEKELIYIIIDYKLNILFTKIYWDYRYCAMITKNMDDMDKWVECISQNDFIRAKYYSFMSQKIIDAHEFDVDKFLINFNLATARNIFKYIDFKLITTSDNVNKYSLIGVAMCKQKWDIVKILYQDIQDKKRDFLMYGNIFTGSVEYLNNIFKSVPKLLTKEQLADNNLIYNLESNMGNYKLANIIETGFQNMVNNITEIMGLDTMLSILNYLLFSLFSYKCENNCDSLITKDNETFDVKCSKMVHKTLSYIKLNFAKNGENNTSDINNKYNNDFELFAFVSCVETRDSYMFSLIQKITKQFCKKHKIDIDDINTCFENTYFNCNDDILNDEIYNICLNTIQL
jgi:hypothetical protein